jgi:NAD+ synthase
MSLGDEIVTWLREQISVAGADGLALGLSGGIDSAVTGALAKRALGDRALGVLMPCHSVPEDLEVARLVARTFDIQTLTVDLTPAYEALLTALPPDGTELSRANLKPRLRMTALYYLANSRNYLVAGTGNKSELTVGYFTKYGDGGVDLLPLGDLYKWQVRELARELGVPQQVIVRPPSAGLWAGQTDEGEMGITYEELDTGLSAIESGKMDGLKPAVLARIHDMIARSAHKRAPTPVFRVTS